jgi:hypothetical protein
MAKNGDIYAAFKDEFRVARDKVYRRYNNKAPLGDVIEVMVEAAYQNLVDVVLAKFIFEGKVGTGEKLPSERIRDREKATTEILALMGSDLTLLDTKHEYSVGIMKRSRKTERT